MLRQLSIRNFAIIDDLTIDFNEGFNVFTGETGAGKSIIIDALGLLMGERASASMVRYGANKAFVQGVFEPRKPFSALLMDYLLDEETLIITKEIDAQGKSTCKINGRICSISIIKNIMPGIIDIHNQNENQYLMDHKSHLELLDNYIGLSKLSLYQDYQKHFEIYHNLQLRKTELQKMKFDSEKLELLQHQKNEIEEAKIGKDELEELELERARIMQYEKIAEKIRMIDDYFGSDQGIIGALYGAKKVFESIHNDPLFDQYGIKMNNYYFEISEMYSNFKKEAGNLNYDTDRIEEIQNRIFAINKIKRKYGQTYQEIMNTYQKIDQDIASLNHIEEDKVLVEEKIRQTLLLLNDIGNKLHVVRQKNAVLLEKAIKSQLKELSLENTIFKIDFEKLSEPTAKGLYDCEYQISLNPGTPLKPLIKVISGGEMSRLMLGLKVIFNTIYGISVTVFDEIDAGVSGNVARAVGKKMQQLSKQMQVICITHLPQVASLADVHYYVSKKVVHDKTTTDVTILNKELRVYEIAKMLSGDKKPSEAALNNAGELIEKKEPN